jgi:hypothetical protein
LLETFEDTNGKPEVIEGQAIQWSQKWMFGMFKNNLEKMNIIASKKLTRCTNRVKGHMSCSFLVFSELRREAVFRFVDIVVNQRTGNAMVTEVVN